MKAKLCFSSLSVKLIKTTLKLRFPQNPEAIEKTVEFSKSWRFPLSTPFFTIDFNERDEKWEEIFFEVNLLYREEAQKKHLYPAELYGSASFRLEYATKCRLWRQLRQQWRHLNHFTNSKMPTRPFSRKFYTWARKLTSNFGYCRGKCSVVRCFHFVFWSTKETNSKKFFPLRIRTSKDLLVQIHIS